MSKVLLLVEDNATDEKLTVRALKKNNIGNEIVVVHDGQEAIDYLLGAVRQPLPTVVLLDLKLPASSAQDEDLVKSYSLGANAYVRKPVDFGLFLEAARTLGMFWLLLNKPPPSRP